MSRYYCKNVSMLAIGQGEEDTVLTRVRCKQWSCQYCAYINRVQWNMRIMRAMQQNRATWGNFAFVTITAHEKMRTPKKSYKTLQNALSKLLKRMRRKNAYSDMPYVRVFEPHKSGALHAHLIIHWTTDLNATDKQNTRWLKDNARSCGAGYQADYRTITPGYDPGRQNGRRVQEVLQVAAYVVKYMTKDLQQTVEEEAYPRMRRIQASQHFPPKLATDVEDRDWRVESRYTYDQFVEDTKPVKDNQTGMKITAVHFIDAGQTMYPDGVHLDAWLRRED